MDTDAFPFMQQLLRENPLLMAEVAERVRTRPDDRAVGRDSADAKPMKKARLPRLAKATEARPESPGA